MRGNRRVILYMAILVLSAAGLAWEIILTRLFAITQFYHFAFLAVNVALLGFGASGSLLALRPAWTRRAEPAFYRRLEVVAVAFAITLLGGYAFVNTWPFDSYAIAWDWTQLWLLIGYYLALAIPFICIGLAVGMALAVAPEASNRAYAANLLGSATGGLSAPLLLGWLEIPGVIFVLGGLGLLAAVILAMRRPGPRLAIYALMGGALVWAAVRPPGPAMLNLSPYKGLSQALNYPGAEVIAQSDHAIARLSLVDSQGIRSLPGLSFQYQGPLPPQYGLFTDGGDLSPVLDTRQEMEWAFLKYLPEALAYELAPEGPALVLKPEGGLAIWQALAGGASARQATAITPNPDIPEQLAALLDRDSPYRHPQVETVAEDARSALQQDADRYAVIHLALTDPYRPVTSGAFSLYENYALTVEAMQAYLDHLRPDGVLVFSRWLQVPPSESVRALALLVAALEAEGITAPRQHIVALRGVQVATFYAKLTPWSADGLAAVRTFARSRRLDLTWAPNLAPAEINRFNLLPEPYYHDTYRRLLDAPDRQAFYARQPFAIDPPTDSDPFFFHFFRWAQTLTVLRTLGQTWQPFGGSGILLLVALLILAALASAFLILLPLAIGRWARRGSLVEREGAVALWRVVVYFGALGLGFLLVEIPLIQRFILFLGHPTLALAVVLAGVLFWSGLGSLFAPRLGWRTALLVLLMVLVAYQLGLSAALELWLGAPGDTRVLAALGLLAPLGLLMGMAFPWGLRWLGQLAPGLTAWAWAINGCASVISSVLAALLALQGGFDLVLWLGVGCYALALAVAWPDAGFTPGISRPRAPAARNERRPR